MIQDLYIIHRRKPFCFESTELPVWSTCLRSLGFGASAPERQPHANDEVFARQDAYSFLLEVVCGLHSPILGETEVFGQFKQFGQEWIRREPRRATLVQRILNDAKSVRNQYLQNLGAQSYGSWVRKNLKPEMERVHFLGAGLLVRDILPYVQKRPATAILHARDVQKIDFFDGDVRPLSGRGFDGGAVIVAAPLTSAQIVEWLGVPSTAAQIFDLRDTSLSDPLPSHAGCEIFRLADVFAEIEQTKARLLPVVELARTEIVQRSQRAMEHSLLRPLGWDDLCA